MPRKHAHRWQVDETNFGRCRCKETRQFTGGLQDPEGKYVWSLRRRHEAMVEHEFIPIAPGAVAVVER